jgi:Rad3-related DNA helicase
LIPSIHGGILVFFTSYTHLRDCAKEWERKNLFFNGVAIFKEERDSTKTKESYLAYIANVKT